MTVSERIEYINKHRELGDVKAVAGRLGLKYNTVRDVINGRNEGPNCDTILKCVEKIISSRMKRQEKLRSKYSQKLKSSGQ